MNDILLKNYFLAARNGDKQAYHLFLKHLCNTLPATIQRGIYRYSPQNKDLVDDILQETLFTIHQKQHLYDETYPIMPWIYTICRHKIVDVLRRNKSGKWVSLEDIHIEVESEIGHECQEKIRDLEKALKQLSEKDRHLIVQHKLEQNTADSLPASGALRIAVHRALKKLKIILEES
jgi:RNA polymerase sigma-70 factor (ECF subfamily)